ncbi:MAG: hypothetical protein VB137_07340 [Burkholderia sp.]
MLKQVDVREVAQAASNSKKGGLSDANVLSSCVCCVANPLTPFSRGRRNDCRTRAVA